MHRIDPLTDPRWDVLVSKHGAACAFHTSDWLRALAHTYGYQPFVLTSSPADSPLTDGVPLCRVDSWATGARLVSLPFTDHCQPLASSTDVDNVLEYLQQVVAEEKKTKFAELRPARPTSETAIRWAASAEYVAHWLDVTGSIESLFNALDKDSIQRKIRRAEREKLEYREGRSAEIIDIFYGLLLRTRRRHQLPPQPKAWFRTLAQTMDDTIQFRLAVKEGVPAAAIVTLSHPNSMIYKYGCSDERYHATGAMPFLYWRMIQDAKGAGIPLVDFGRSDLDNPGLIRFKDQWGTRKTTLKYYRFPAPTVGRASSASMLTRAAKTVFARLPDPILETVGKIVYKHIG